MNLHHGLICFFLLSLQDGKPGFISAQIFYRTVLEGGHVKLECPSSSASSRKFLCKESCKQRDILIETDAVSFQSGRFSIEWRRKGRTSLGYVFVNMSHLTKSDSGRYRCGVDGSLSSAIYNDFEIIVVDALLDGDLSETRTLYPRNTGNFTVACYFHFILTLPVTEASLCLNECLTLPTVKNDDTKMSGRYTIRYAQFTDGVAVYGSISQPTRSDSGRYTCGFKISRILGFARTFEVNVTAETSTSVPLSTTPSTKQSGASTTDILLYVGILVALVVLFSLALLIFCRRKSLKPKKPPVETEYATISDVKYTKPSGKEIKSEDSSTPRSPSPGGAEDDLSKITYSELDFSERTFRPLNSAPSGHGDNVIYSTPR